MSIIIMGSEKQREAPFLQLSNSIIRNSERSNHALGDIGSASDIS